MKWNLLKVALQTLPWVACAWAAVLIAEEPDFIRERYWLAEHSVVKITSQWGEKRLEGSGLLFRHRNRAFVITSDHTFWHANAWRDSPVTHEIQNKNLGTFRAQYLVSDWGRGLGLLELGPLDLNLVHFYFNDAMIVGPEKWKEFDFQHYAGFPFGSDQLRVGDRTIPIHMTYGDDWPSQVHPLAQVIRLNSAAEYGMSGGAFFENRTLLWGILSYNQPLIEGLSPDTFAVGARTIGEFLNRFFGGKIPECEQSLEHQRRRELPGCAAPLMANLQKIDPWPQLARKWRTLHSSLYYSFQYALSFSPALFSSSSDLRQALQRYMVEETESELEKYFRNPSAIDAVLMRGDMLLSKLRKDVPGDYALSSFYASVEAIQAFLLEFKTVP